MMENAFKKTVIALCLLMGCIVLGQEENDVDFTHIYNKWVFSPDESSNGIQVYRNEEFFGDNEEKEKIKRWRFAVHSDVFLNTPYSKGKMGFIPNKPRPSSKICNRGGKYGFIPPKRTEGKWKLVEADDETLLELRYYEIEKGRSFQLKTTLMYRVMHLEKNLMELIRINRIDVL